MPKSYGIESGERLYPVDNKDLFPSVLARAALNSFVAKPVDFNLEGQLKAQEYSSPSLTETDSILDVGCNSGYFVLEAAKTSKINTNIIGVDPYDDYYKSFMKSGFFNNYSRLKFIRAYGENIPLPNDSVRVASAHNVLFRAKDLFQMLDEIKRVVEPGGLILISTNAKDHAKRRHDFEQRIAEEVFSYLQAKEDSSILKSKVEFPPPPAEKCYWEDLPNLLSVVGGLSAVLLDYRQSHYEITRDRLDLFLWVLQTSAVQSSLEPKQYYIWRAVVNQIIKPEIEAEILGMEESNLAENVEIKPFFADTFRRGMMILRNEK